jgi:hypothetical protein
LRRRGAGPGRSGSVGWTVKRMDFIIGGGEGERLVGRGDGISAARGGVWGELPKRRWRRRMIFLGGLFFLMDGVDVHTDKALKKSSIFRFYNLI